jgi:hypothetical protein
MDIAHRVLFGTFLKRFLNESVMETLESGVGVGVGVGVGAEVVAGVQIDNYPHPPSSAPLEKSSSNASSMVMFF